MPQVLRRSELLPKPGFLEVIPLKKYFHFRLMASAIVLPSSGFRSSFKTFKKRCLSPGFSSAVLQLPEPAFSGCLRSCWWPTDVSKLFVYSSGEGGRGPSFLST